MINTSDNKLLASDGDQRFTACLNHSQDNDGLYAYGYLEAADALIENLEATGRGVHIFLYPIMFLCRHHLELKLKSITEDAISLLDVELSKEEKKCLTTNHELPKLWSIAQKYLNQIWPEGDQAILEPTSTVLSEIEAIDPKSFVSRYPTDNKTNEKHFKGSVPINILTFRERIDEAITMLDAIETGIAEYQDCKNTELYEAQQMAMEYGL